MNPISLYSKFKEIFPERVDHVIRYKGLRNNGGIDIYCDDGSILNFNIDKTGRWTLTKGGNK